MFRVKAYIVAWLVASLASVAVAAGDGSIREVPAPKFQPERLHLSLQNEVDAALSRAADWLQARQAVDGHWDESNRIATAYAVLALDNGGAAEAAARGRLWLQRTAAGTTNNFWTAMACGIGQAPLPPAHQLDFTQPFTLDIEEFKHFSAAAVYLLAEINRAIPGGLVLVPTGWRNLLAAQVVAMQRYGATPPGSGFWSEVAAVADGSDVAQTALAMLVLQQL